MDDVRVGAQRIAYRRRGDGPCLVLLHGAPCDSRVWRTQLESLSDEFTVVAWDAPGCGESSDPPGHFRMPDYADCLGRFVDALGMPRVHLLGHSWGSALALEVYRQRPEAVSSLVLVGAYAGWAGSLPPEEVDRRLQFALHVASLPPGEFDPASMFGLFSDAMPRDRAAELRTIMGETRAAGITPMAYALAEADLREVLPGVNVPTLLIYGDADQRSPLTVARELNDSIRGSTLTVMPGLGHECFLESAEAFDAEVRRFLEGVG